MIFSKGREYILQQSYISNRSKATNNYSPDRTMKQETTFVESIDGKHSYLSRLGVQFALEILTHFENVQPLLGSWFPL